MRILKKGSMFQFSLYASTVLDSLWMNLQNYIWGNLVRERETNEKKMENYKRRENEKNEGYIIPSCLGDEASRKVCVCVRMCNERRRENKGIGLNAFAVQSCVGPVVLGDLSASVFMAYPPSSWQGSIPASEALIWPCSSQSLPLMFLELPAMLK